MNDMRVKVTTMRSQPQSRFALDDEDQKEVVEYIWKFLERVLMQVKDIETFKKNKFVNSRKFENCLEKFVYLKLHDLLFAADGEDMQLDRKMAGRMKDLQFITTEHLEIQSITHGVLETPVGYLKDINKYKCPADKFLCIKYCARGIADILRLEKGKNVGANRVGQHPVDTAKKEEETQDQVDDNIKEAVSEDIKAPYGAQEKEWGKESSIATVEEDAEEGPTPLPGADDFLPIMILVLKEANPDQLHSNIKYLQHYTHATKLSGESGYILTQFMSAAVFLENADAAALTISPLEFERAIERCKELAEAQAKEIEGMKRAVFTFQSPSSYDDKDDGRSDVEVSDDVGSSGSGGDKDGGEDGGFNEGDVRGSAFIEDVHYKQEEAMQLLPSLSIHDIRKGKSHMMRVKR